MSTKIVNVPSRARSTERGFTLMELITVIVIIAIVSGVAIARTSSTYQSRQRAAARQIASELAFIRQQAIATGRATWVRITPSTEVMDYFQNAIGAAASTGTAVAISDPSTGRSMSTTLNSSTSGPLNSAGVAISTFNASTSQDWLGFDWLGRPLDSSAALRTSNVSLIITASQGSVTFPNITITVVARTGDMNVTMP